MANRAQATAVKPKGARSRLQAVPPPVPSKASPRSNLSALVNRSRFAAHLGLSFLGADGQYARNIYTALGYDVDLTFAKYYGRYLRGGIAQRLVEAYPKATWTDGVYIQEDPNPATVTNFEVACQELFQRLDAWNRIMRVDILAGIGHYAVVMIGAPGDPKTPLPMDLDEKSIYYLTPLSEDDAKIANFVDNTADPRYGQPEFYDVTLGNTVGTQSVPSRVRTARVHWSRMIHVAEDVLNDDVYGKPRLRAVWNYLNDLEKIVGGGAEAAWKRMDPGMQVDIDPEMDLDPDEEERLTDEIDEYVHQVRRVMRTRGTKVNLLSTTVAGFGPNADTVIQLISATSGIPYRILIGSERGELSSNQDRHNWADRVNERRRSFAYPCIVRQLIDRFILHGVLPQPKTYTLVWPRVEELDEKSKSEILSAIAAANNNQMSAEGTIFITADEVRDIMLGLKPLPKEVLDRLDQREKDRNKKAADAAADKSADQGDRGSKSKSKDDSDADS